MNWIARRGDYDVMVTGQNLEDEAALLLGNTLTWHLGYLSRQGPLLEASLGLVRKRKSLCRFYEQEIAANILLCKKNISDECPFSFGAKTIFHKEILN